MEADIKKWLKAEGVAFLKEIGIKKGQTVLDFGCGVGHYTIPAARTVGKKGKVYGVDKNGEVLDELMRTAESAGLENIEPLKTETGLEDLRIKDSSVDTVLLYDIIHLVSDRNKLYEEISEILKPQGLLSIYPKHYKSDQPGWGLEDMDLTDIIEEIEKAMIYFEGKFFKKLVHNNNYDKGYILNFRKDK